MYNQLAATSHEQDAENSELQAIFPAFSDLYFRLDLEGTILDCHQGQLTSSTNFPMAPETFLGQPLQTMLPPVVGEQFRAALSEVVETQALVRLEYTLTLQDQLHHYEAKLLPLPNNQVFMLVGEISKAKQVEAERRQAEAALRASQAELLTLFGAMQDVILVLNAEGRYLKIAPSCAPL